MLLIGTVATVTLTSTFVTNNKAIYAQPTTLDEVNAKQQEVKVKLSKAESKIADILYEIKEINEKIKKLQHAIDENNKQIEKTEKQIKSLQKEIDELNEKIEKRNEILKTRIASYQHNGGNVQFIEVLFGAEGFTDFISRYEAVTTITKADMELIEENERDKQAVEEKLAEQEDLKNELEEQNATIKAQKKQQEESKKELKKKEQKLQREKAELESESSDLRALEAQIRAEMAAPVAVTPSNSSSSSSDSNNSTSNNSGSKKDNSAKKVAYAGTGKSAISAGYSVIGTPYVWAGKSPGGFDCSGFVSWAYAQEGISIPSSTAGLSGVGTKISYSEAKPGDLVFFNTYKTNGHVGIYLGGGKFIGAQNSTGVAVADMSSGYWKSKFSGHVRRVK